jgi:hypothetical protein
MSGGIAQLVAVGAQDAHLVGKPEVSFFRSNYKRHTNFAQVVDRQVIQGNQIAGGMSTVRFERKGDLLSYVYFTAKDGNRTEEIVWSNYVSKVELLIGGQVIDEQDIKFMTELAPDLLAQNLSKSSIGSHFVGGIGNSEWFLPLRFWFCENFQSALPLVALQFHDVELRITWGSLADKTIECFANFISLDSNEREAVSSGSQNMLIYQVQKAIASYSKIQDLNFNHPVKLLASPYSATGAGLTSNVTAVKLQINGTDISDAKNSLPNFTIVTSYYHSPFAIGNTKDFFLYPFCLDTSKHQPTGSLNFSRIDSARLVSDNEPISQPVYAINHNILRIQNGMGGLAYSN